MSEIPEISTKFETDHRNHHIIEFVITFILMSGVSTLVPFTDLRWWIILVLHLGFGLTNYSDGFDRGYLAVLVKVRDIIAKNPKIAKEKQ
jgi:hypothetical protein